ncbi:MAG TPA: sigma-54 dependent transcriptional regulator [Terracidiphilus sp.]|nr:sigma-54 dependent transcriptional regulator [Terracidiphilus sp.]
MKERVLVVEDDAMMLEILSEGLRIEGFDVSRATSVPEGIQEILTSAPSIVLADYKLREGTAFDLLAWLNAEDLRIPLIVLTAHAEIELAVEAVKNGAERLIPKPVDIGFLSSEVRRTLEHYRNLQKAVANRLDRARYDRDPFLGNTRAIAELRTAATRMAKVNNTVLIQGETGTGKGVLARWLHKMGPRSNEPFVDLNCAGLSQELLESELFGHQKGAFTGAIANKVGFLEAANHGALFLDEIGDMAIQVQPKILKVVEDRQFYRLGDVRERKVDLQMIAATHRDLKKMADEGGFRSDLYFRISALSLRIPPLRERMEDIPLITDKLLEVFSWEMKRGGLRITDRARWALQQYAWPGNIRELRNVLERAAILSDDGVIDKTGLEFAIPAQQSAPANLIPPNLTLKEMERHYIRQVLAGEGGNVPIAARRLGMPRSTLYAKLKEYGL